MPSVAPFARSIRPLIAAAPLLVLAACGGGDRNAAQGGMAGQTPEVGYVVVQPTQAPVTTELAGRRSEEHTSELQSLMRISYAVFCLKKKKKTIGRKT